MASKDSARLQCAFTVDVEDWYQSSVDFDAPISERVLRNMERVLRLLDDHHVKATFFIQGMVAEAYPSLLRDLLAEGHEIQSHGYSHRPLYGMDRAALREELQRARESVEDACGARVTAFRAPDFSILEDNLWALETLAETGFEVDSSIFPVRMPRYGIPGTPLHPHRRLLSNGATMIEAPVAVWQWGALTLPVAGGGYFRLLPLPVLRRAFKSLMKRGQPVIIYCHPYEFNPGELEEFRGRVPDRFLTSQGLGRASFIQRMHSLLEEFSFGRMDSGLSRERIE